MQIDDILDVGSDILNDVTEAIDKNNFNGLGQRVSDRVFDVTDQLKQEMAYKAKQTANDWYARDKNNGQNQQQARNRAQSYYRSPQTVAQPPSTFIQKKVSRNDGMPQVVFGTLGTVVGGVVTAISIITAASVSAVSIIFGGVSVGCGLLLLRGVGINELSHRYYEYGNLIGQNEEYISISNLAARARRLEQKTKKDIEKMIHRGYLPQARLDTQGTTLMLTDHAYEQYRQAEAGRLEREAEEERLQDELNAAGADKQVRAILDEGKVYIQKVRTIKAQLPPSDEMAEKLARQEEITNKIFEQVTKHPETAADLRKFMEYYLPTTDKLLDAYMELNGQPQVENVKSTRQEIVSAMDTINEAFENLLDSLFQDMAWDISSDISVMKTMLAQDGLMEKNRM